MPRFLLITTTTFLFLLSVNAHPGWFSIPGLEQLIPTHSTPTSSNSLQAPHAHHSLSHSSSPSLSHSYSPGYQPQASQPVQVQAHAQSNSPPYIPQNRPVAYGIAQRPVAQPLPPASSSPLVHKSSGPPSQYGNSYSGNQVGQTPSAYGNPAGGQGYWFKEGTPILPCAYGAGQNGIPMPQYNDPRKKCNPWSPACGWLFTCIVDV